MWAFSTDLAEFFISDVRQFFKCKLLGKMTYFTFKSDYEHNPRLCVLNKTKFWFKTLGLLKSIYNIIFVPTFCADAFIKFISLLAGIWQDPSCWFANSNIIDNIHSTFTVVDLGFFEVHKTFFFFFFFLRKTERTFFNEKTDLMREHVFFFRFIPKGRFDSFWRLQLIYLPDCQKALITQCFHSLECSSKCPTSLFI